MRLSLFLYPDCGAFEDDVLRFREEARYYGTNAAFRSPVHCALTAEFECPERLRPRVITTLDSVLAPAVGSYAVVIGELVQRVIAARGTTLEIQLDVAGLRDLLASFADGVRVECSDTEIDVSPGRSLHVTLLVDCAPSIIEPLVAIAKSTIRKEGQTHWRLGVFERCTDDTTWILHWSCALSR